MISQEMKKADGILKQQKTFIYLVQKIQENMQQKYLIIYQNQKQ